MQFYFLVGRRALIYSCFWRIALVLIMRGGHIYSCFWCWPCLLHFFFLVRRGAHIYSCFWRIALVQDTIFLVFSHVILLQLFYAFAEKDFTNIIGQSLVIYLSIVFVSFEFQHLDCRKWKFKAQFLWQKNN